VTWTGRLFDPEPADSVGTTDRTDNPSGPDGTSSPGPAGGFVAPLDGAVAVRVLPDVSGLDKEFDYLLPEKLTGRVEIGDQVRVMLNGRSIRGWITAVGFDSPHGVSLRPVTRVVSAGPSAEVVSLARWAGRQWQGRVASILKSASPPRVVPSLAVPVANEATVHDGAAAPADVEQTSAEAETGAGRAVDGAEGGEGGAVELFRLPPAADLLPLLLRAWEYTGGGNVVVVVPRVDLARGLVGRLRQQGVATRVHPRDWATAAHRGGMVIGARSAVWARLPSVDLMVVIDEHDEALQEERNPTWHARDVAIERARRAGVACWLVSPSPSAAAVVAAELHHGPSRREERDGWPIVELVDRRQEEPGRGGLFSPPVTNAVREPGTVLGVLNRKGRAVMLACAMCGELVLTEDGERLMVERDGVLVCPPTGESRPIICANCGATKLKRLRLGVTRAAEELAALISEPVDEITGDHNRDGRRSRVLVGTEAALHQVSHVDRVVFLDFDQELMAPRYRAAEQAMALLILAARLTGGRHRSASRDRRDAKVGGAGRVLVQTRSPEHRVLSAVVRSDPSRFVHAEVELRRSLAFPPFAALAELSGPGAAEVAAWLSAWAPGGPAPGTEAPGEPAPEERAPEEVDPDPLASSFDSPGIQILGPRHDGRYLVRADNREALALALQAAPKPSRRVRVAVDPPRA